MHTMSGPGIFKLYLAAALAVTGCAAPKGRFQSLKEPGYAGKLERVLLVYRNVNTESTLGRQFSDRLAKRMAMLLEQKSVPSESVRLEREVLDRTAPIKAAAIRFRPKQLLYFGVTRADSVAGMRRVGADLPQFRSELSVTLEFSVVDAQSGRTVWRTEAYFYSPPEPEAVADQLFDEFRASQIF